jgi:hypothetical protein
MAVSIVVAARSLKLIQTGGKATIQRWGAGYGYLFTVRAHCAIMLPKRYILPGNKTVLVELEPRLVVG